MNLLLVSIILISQTAAVIEDDADENLLVKYQQYPLNTQSRPCPLNCSCNYDTIYCSDLIEHCDECVHWPQIDFNRVAKLKRESFKHYKFAPNKMTNIFIYNLLNDTINENSFKDFHVPENSHIEITFHYNSLIKFNEYSLNGIHLDTNSTLVFNFPFTTQVLFLKNCFHGIYARDANSRFIVRILKSFMVRFAASHAPVASLPSNSWTLNSGQFIIDIKSTRLVKFEEDFFANMNLNSHTKVYIDLELIEKLIFYQNTFNNVNLFNNSQLTLYLKQVNYINFKDNVFRNINLYKKSSIRVFLSDLTNSLCLNENLFSNVNLNNELTFVNFTFINSKNIVLTRNSFKNIKILGENSKLAFHVYNLPSLLFKKFNKQINQERSSYLLPVYDHLKPIDAYFAKLDTISTDEYDDYEIDSKFYIIPKQTYLYNLSIEEHTFFNISSASGTLGKNIVFLVDNINTVLIDNQIATSMLAGDATGLELFLNIKNFITQKFSFLNFNNVFIKFYKEPKLAKFDYESLKANANIRVEKANFNGVLVSGADEVDDSVLVKNNTTMVLCDSTEWKASSKAASIDKTLKPCTCGNFRAAVFNAAASKNRYFPCVLQQDSTNNCQIQFDLHCYNIQIISNDAKKLVVRNKVDLRRDENYVKFWRICSSMKEVNNSANYELTSFYNSFFFYNVNENDSFIGDGLSSSLLNLSDETDNAKEELSGGNIGKTIGILVISLVIGIIFFMVIINLIQYKFRGDQFDDFDDIGGVQQQPWSWKRTFSVQSLKRTLSVTSLKRNKRDSCKVVTVKASKCSNNDAGDDYYSSGDDDDFYEKNRLKSNESSKQNDIELENYDERSSSSCSNENEAILVHNSSSASKNESTISSENDTKQRDCVSNETEITSLQATADNNNNNNKNSSFEKHQKTHRKANEDLGYYSHD